MNFPQRTPFFYGWVIVGVVMVSGSFMVGITSWGLSVFIIPMEQELGWSRSTILAALAMGAGVGALLGPVLGPLGDTRHGPRLMFIAGAFAFALSLVYLRQVTETWEYFLFYGIIGGLARFGIQMASNLVPKWFVRRRGIAIAWASAGSGLGPFIFPIVIQTLINAVGWRDAWLYLGIISLLVLLPLAFLLYTTPEEVGLKPDGEREGDAASQGAGGRQVSAATEYSYTRGEALRTRLFWLVLVAVTMGNFGMMGFIPFIVPFLQDQGFSPNVAAASVTTYAVTGVLMRFGWGYVTTRMPTRRTFMLQCFVSGLALAALFTVFNMPMLFAVMLFVGFGFGGFWVLQGLIIADYFGRQHTAAVRGLINPFMNGSGYAGPLVLGIIFDFAGGYFWVFAAAILGWLCAVAAVYFARPRVRPSQEQPSVTASQA